MYLVDTPGVLPPKLGDVETGMKLALCGEAEAVAGGTPQTWLRAPAGPGARGWGSSLLLACPPRSPQAGVRCLGAHGCHVDGGRGGRGSERGWGELGLDPLFQEPSVTTW